MKEDGLQRMLTFLDFLRENGVSFLLDQQGPDGLIILFSLYGIRAEVTFTVAEMQYHTYASSSGDFGRMAR